MSQPDILNKQAELAAKTENTRKMSYGDLFDFLQTVRSASISDEEQRMIEGFTRILDSVASVASENYQTKPYPTADELLDKMNEHGGVGQFVTWAEHRREGMLANAKDVTEEQEGGAITNMHVIGRKKVELSEPPESPSHVVRRVKVDLNK